MYEMWIKNSAAGTVLMHSTDADSYYRVLSGSFTEIAASICRPTAQFSIAPQNPAYEYIREMTTLLEIRNTLTDEVEFEGRIIRKLRDSLGSDGKIIREYAAEGLISWLLDSLQVERSIAMTPTQALTYMLGQHNARHPEKEILLGTCDVNTGIILETNYRSTLEEINVNLLQKLGGEIAVRRGLDGKLYLDYLQDGIGEDSSVVVRLGRNLKSLNKSTDPTKVVNRLIPLGAKQNDGSRLTLRGYFIEDPNKFWIDNDSSAYTYSSLEGVATFDDAVTQQTLARLGTAELAKLTAPKVGYSAEVLDLSTIGEDDYPLRAGNTYNFVCSAISLDADLRLTKRTVNILKPYAPTVEIGSKPERLSYAAGKSEKATENIEEKIETEYVTKEEFDDHLDDMQEYIDALEVWRESDETVDPPESVPLPDTMEVLKQWQSDTATYLTNLEAWRTGELQTWRRNVDTAIEALQSAVTTLQNTVVTSADIRTINVVQSMPANPVATALYVADGGTS